MVCLLDLSSDLGVGPFFSPGVSERDPADLGCWYHGLPSVKQSMATSGQLASIRVCRAQTSAPTPLLHPRSQHKPTLVQWGWIEISSLGDLIEQWERALCPVNTLPTLTFGRNSEDYRYWSSILCRTKKIFRRAFLESIQSTKFWTITLIYSKTDQSLR